MTSEKEVVGYLQTGGTASSAFHICRNFRRVLDGSTYHFKSDGALCGAKPVKEWSWGLKGNEPTCGRCIRIRDSKEGRKP